MKRLILCLTLLASPALAETPACLLNGAAPLDALERAKSAFLAGRYEEFYDAAAPLVSNRQARMAEIIGPVQNLFPDGFPDCAVVMQRRDDGGMVQEVSLFRVPAPGKGYMALLLTAVPLGSDHRVVYFSYNDQISQVLEDVR